jgi:mannose-6-phosphate isomerase-like protein (cupin superfamily)
MADEIISDDLKDTATYGLADNQKFTLAEALAKLPGPDGKRFATVFERGSLQIEIYAPRGHDPQSPHTRDEIYVVMQGSGEFINGQRRHFFGPGDFLFVPAGIEHRFVNFTDDFVTWVIFYGPEGGENLVAMNNSAE